MDVRSLTQEEAVERAALLDLDEHAPSATLGREARRFVGDFREVREAAAAL